MTSTLLTVGGAAALGIAAYAMYEASQDKSDHTYDADDLTYDEAQDLKDPDFGGTHPYTKEELEGPDDPLYGGGIFGQIAQTIGFGGIYKDWAPDWIKSADTYATVHTTNALSGAYEWVEGAFKSVKHEFVGDTQAFFGGYFGQLLSWEYIGWVLAGVVAFFAAIWLLY